MSFAKNTILYTIKTICSMIFPLITFPYISRTLSATGIGQYTFATSIISYFSLIASLGISTYAVKEGAKFRDDKKKINSFASQIFTINCISTLVSVILLLLCLVIFHALRPYVALVLILAIAIPMNTLGAEWLFVIFEDFTYITVRSIAIQLLSIIMMFCCVKTESDVIVYAMISTIASAGSNLLNFTYAKKYINHRIAVNRNLFPHIKPILILFSTTIASQIYINADSTMLGLIRGDYDTGMYAVATKVYNIVCVLITSILSIILPRLTYIMYNKGNTEYIFELKKLSVLYISIVIPVSIGLASISKPITLFLAGDSFEKSYVALSILCFALIFSTIGSFIANAVLIIYSQEKIILKATCIGAAFNIIANLFLISTYSFIGAAITTLVSEMIVFSIQLYYAKKQIVVDGLTKDIIKIIVGSCPIVFVCGFIKSLSLGNIFTVLFSVLLSTVVYIIAMVVFKNTIFINCMKGIIYKCAKQK
ncbi:MAG: flippase [Lachnospiraceae bacterium]